MNMDFLVFGVFVYATIGICAGLMAGILGVGGGIIVVPGLAFVFEQAHIIPHNLIMHAAAGTSLAVMIITSFASLRAHLKLGRVLWPVYNRLWPGIVLGTISGAVLADFLTTFWLKTIFSIFLFAVSLKMLADLHVTHPHRFPKNWLNRLVSYLIGLKSGLLGVGGGVLVIPYLTYCGVTTRKITAVSNLCTFTVAVVGTASFIVTGSNEVGLPELSTGYIYWPAVLWVAMASSIAAPLGARLNYKLPVKKLRYGFIVILMLTAVDMFLERG